MTDNNTGKRKLSFEYEYFLGFDEDGNYVYNKSTSKSDSFINESESNYEYEFDENGRQAKRYEYDAEHDLVGWEEYEYEPIEGKNAYAVGKMWGATCPAYITGGNGGNTVFGGIDDKAGGTNISIHTYKAIRRLVV